MLDLLADGIAVGLDMAGFSVRTGPRNGNTNTYYTTQLVTPKEMLEAIKAAHIKEEYEKAEQRVRLKICEAMEEHYNFCFYHDIIPIALREQLLELGFIVEVRTEQKEKRKFYYITWRT